MNGRKELPWEKRLEYDVEYVEHLSFAFDVKIFLKTVAKVFTNADNVNTAQTAPVACVQLHHDEDTVKESAVK